MAVEVGQLCPGKRKDCVTVVVIVMKDVNALAVEQVKNAITECVVFPVQVDGETAIGFIVTVYITDVQTVLGLIRCCYVSKFNEFFQFACDAVGQLFVAQVLLIDIVKRVACQLIRFTGLTTEPLTDYPALFNSGFFNRHGCGMVGNGC